MSDQRLWRRRDCRLRIAALPYWRKAFEFFSFGTSFATMQMVSGMFLLMPRAFPYEEQVAECEQGKKLRAYLCQLQIVGFPRSEMAFGDAEGMLDFGPYHREDAVDPLV